MPNPIFNFSSNKDRSGDPSGIFGMINMVRNAPDPNTAMQSLISSNPNIQEVMQYVNQNGGDARAAFYNLAAQKGVDPNTILNRLR